MTTEKEQLNYATPPKPTLENVKIIRPNAEDFNNPEKAEALITNLNLKVGDTLIENDDSYIVNPRYVLNGMSPYDYKTSIEHLKKILTKQEIKNMSRAINKNTKDYNKKLYDKLDKRLGYYYHKREIKKSIPLGEIRTALEYFKQDRFTGLFNTIYHLLSKGQEKYLLCYKTAWKNLPIPDLREWREENDGEYDVFTDEEAEQRFNDYFEDSDYLWIDAVKEKQTTLGFDEWVEWVKESDGRGNSLNHYDGREEVETINDTEYYIYRTN